MPRASVQLTCIDGHRHSRPGERRDSRVSVDGDEPWRLEVDGDVIGPRSHREEEPTQPEEHLHDLAKSLVPA